MRTEDLIHFCAPARLIMEKGARARLPALIAHLGYTRGVLVTDTFFTTHTSWVREYVDAARALGVATHVFDGGAPDPTTTLCDEATRAVRDALKGHAPDHVIALGGGSNIDLAKALAVTLRDGTPVKHFVGARGPLAALPLIAMPTTAGTGSEATPGAILVDPENATKVAVMDNALRPQIALIDYELTMTCPPPVTADAGIDALTHAIESYLTIDSAAFDRANHPDPGYSGRSSLTMLFARESIRLCARYLKRCYDDGSDETARAAMCQASFYAALSYGSAGLNAVHGIAYAVAGATHRSHGTTNAVMLPYAVGGLRQTRRAELLDIAADFGIDTAGDAGLAIDRLCLRLRELIASVGIPVDLRALGIQEAALDALTRDALAVKRLAQAFPVTDVAAVYADIVRRAFFGDLGKTPSVERDTALDLH
ncbi:iron-containing alcohol dehydrogenase [Caballeronia pedi]|uniref:Iron-containing alcohol dehydrogenase n=1 Tax=Caballeronia pedi TaxID=1777141 RepID=A0A157ZMB5_9BURK|nr:iron-containing alcohol dehydrogenase [Caballeronia pedi]SAK46664.1 iron-containing alcohol dehydrogenase [Caballeronia pedi]